MDGAAPQTAEHAHPIPPAPKQVKKAKAPRTGQRQTKRQALMQELSAELKHLRGVVREVGEHFILRREGELEAILAHLESLPPGAVKARADEWLREIRAMKLKPAKGRLRDLRQLDGLLDDLSDEVARAQNGRKGKGV